VGVAVRRFRYVLDGLSLASISGYAVNRWLFKPHVSTGFLRDHFNDLLLIPAALPVVLWLQRKFRLRDHDLPPTWGEIMMHLTVWSIICEGIGPLWLHHGTADYRDVIAYAAGGILSCLWWHRRSIRTPTFHNEL